jgi:hypothetical protein
MSFAYLFGAFVFGSIGMAGFIYGKKSGLINPMLFGAGLMAYPYFVTSPWLLYGIGLGGTALMVRCRGDE